MEPKLRETDVTEINNTFPYLSCDLNNNKVSGILGFSCIYEKNSGQLILNVESPEAIIDNYEIEIDFNKRDTFGLPVVYERSHKIEEHAKNFNLPIIDLHCNQDSSCCLGVFPNYQWTSACDFIINDILPYLYWQSHLRLKGKEPWSGLSHGIEGLKESLTIPFERIEKGSIRNLLCQCGSGKKYKNCCLKKDRAIKDILIKKYGCH
jgi:hypothetical protein